MAQAGVTTYGKNYDTFPDNINVFSFHPRVIREWRKNGICQEDHRYMASEGQDYMY